MNKEPDFRARPPPFGPFEFDPDPWVLFRNGTPVPLQPRLANLLLVLLEHHGPAVGRDEHGQRVWPDSTMEEIGLARNASLFEEGPRRHSPWQTLPEPGRKPSAGSPLRWGRFFPGPCSV